MIEKYITINFVKKYLVASIKKFLGKKRINVPLVASSRRVMWEHYFVHYTIVYQQLRKITLLCRCAVKAKTFIHC